jgi:hypothetical protein
MGFVMGKKSKKSQFCTSGSVVLFDCNKQTEDNLIFVITYNLSVPVKGQAFFWVVLIQAFAVFVSM